MGSFIKMKAQTIKLLLLGLICCIKANNFESDKESAFSILKTRKTRGLLIKKSWDSYCDWNKVESWTEFQDELEEDKTLPEPEVEALEDCARNCKWLDKGQDFIGNAYEEQRSRRRKYSIQTSLSSLFRCN